MQSSNYIDYLPNEILGHIHSYLYLNDKRFTFTRVCKKWKLFAIKNTQAEISNYYIRLMQETPSEKDMSTILKIIENNNFIHRMVSKKYTFGPEKESIHSDDICLSSDSNFSIGWHHKKCDLIRCSRANIRADFTMRFHLVYNNSSCYTPKVFITTEEAETIRFGYIEYKPSAAVEMTDLVRCGLNFTLKDYVSYLSDANFAHFLLVNMIQDLSFHIFSCNSHGKIFKFKPEKKYNYYFSIQKNTDCNNNLYINWDTNELANSMIDWKPWAHKYKEILRWCVLSRTAKKIAYRLILQRQSFRCS